MAQTLTIRDRAPEPADGPALAGLAFAEALATVLVAAGMTVLPLVAHLLSPALGMAIAVTLAAACALRMPQVSIVAVLFAMMFQNLIVSLLAGHVRSEDDFDIIRGYNFLLLAASWLVVTGSFLLDWQRRKRAVDPFVKISVVLLVAIGVYFLLGFASRGIQAIVYLRNIVTPLLFFHLCLLVFMRRPVRVGMAITLMTVLFAACAYWEFFFRDSWLAWTNGYAYWELASGPNWLTLSYDEHFKETGEVFTGLTDTFHIDFFNSPLLEELGIKVMRLFGANMHAISFSYGILFLSIFALYRGRILLWLPLFGLMILASAKGPLIAFLMVGGAWTVALLFGVRLAVAALLGALIVYAAGVYMIGLGLGDYHVIGLMSGLYEFVRFPLGYGLGVGGNLSPEFVSIDWPVAQAMGRTPFPVESAFGVLLHQLGPFALLLIGTYGWIAWRVALVASATGNALHAATAFAVLAVLANGLFQEEAYFSPLALGLLLGLAGMILGAAIHTGLLASGGERGSIS